MKVLFISPSFYPALHYGGPIFINRDFCQALANAENVQLQVLTTDADGPKRRIDADSIRKFAPGYTVKYCGRTFPPDISLGLLMRLPRLIRRADVVHLQGVYSFTTLPTLALCRLMGKPLVWSTLGALQRWPGTTRKTWKARWEKVCNLLCRPERVVLHVTSDDERAESVEKIPNASVIVLRNGILIPPANGRKAGSHDELRLMFIGRLHPIKGIENLLRALTRVRARVRLSICGEGDADYEARLRLLVRELGLEELVHFQGRVDGEVKERQFREADLCIAPSHKEGFCTVVLEALARGVPVIAGHGTPWQGVEQAGCGLWVSNEPDELARAIDKAAGMPLAEMGARGRAWMERDFSWAHVADEMVAEYERLIESRRAHEVAAVTSANAAQDYQ